jgi:hypothetical protein
MEMATKRFASYLKAGYLLHMITALENYIFLLIDLPG